MDDFPIAESVAGTDKAQRVDGDIEPELVSILETIDNRARDARGLMARRQLPVQPSARGADT